MAIFLKGNQLNAKLEELFENAKKEIILISPYIQLHERYKSALLTRKQDPSIKLSVLFGKNENNLSKSMKEEDFDFFSQFPNVEIRYEKRLHAKYYANESEFILTSMNLYGYSQNNNIEAGVLARWDSPDETYNSSYKYFQTALEQADLLFLKEAIFEERGFWATREYTESVIKVDKLSDFFNEKYIQSQRKVSLAQTKLGYCIRTGKQIPFDVNKPMTTAAYNEWQTINNPNQPENFCHYSGEPSNGKTTFNRPILWKNWKKASAKGWIKNIKKDNYKNKQ